MTLIGLHGVARSGKDSVADILVQHRGFTRVALADAVRDAVYALDPIVWLARNGRLIHAQEAVDDLGGWDELKATDEGRRLLQRMGTEVGRQMFGENVWLDIAARKIDAAAGPVVVTDIRFPNELEWLKSWFSNHSVKIVRPGFGPVNDHASDAGLEDTLFDKVLNNNGTLEDLEHSVLELIKTW